MMPISPIGMRTRVSSSPLGALAAVDHLADRIGQRGDRLDRGGDRLRAAPRRASAGRASPATGRWPRRRRGRCALAARIARSAARSAARGRAQRRGLAGVVHPRQRALRRAAGARQRGDQLRRDRSRAAAGSTCAARLAPRPRACQRHSTRRDRNSPRSRLVPVRLRDIFAICNDSSRFAFDSPRRLIRAIRLDARSAC